MSWNVPDDWGSYYYACGCHASEGGCSCKEGQIEAADRPWLGESGYDLDDGIWSKIISSKVHTCRRNHKNGRITVGTKYRKVTYRQIDDETGETWLTHSKRVLV